MADRSSIEEEVRAIISGQMPDKPDPRTIPDDVPIFRRGLGLDSMSGLSLLTAIEERFNVYIDDDDFDIFDSLRQLVDFILERSVDRDS
ncbi:MAG: acyl carrier protein [Candidatus Krumholzibacteriota bacterium]|nr:acyl carrier protein [Candidatus Krumholzibacteriota bacterium]